MLSTQFSQSSPILSLDFPLSLSPLPLLPFCPPHPAHPPGSLTCYPQHWPHTAFLAGSQPPGLCSHPPGLRPPALAQSPHPGANQGYFSCCLYCQHTTVPNPHPTVYFPTSKRGSPSAKSSYDSKIPVVRRSRHIPLEVEKSYSKQ